MFSTEVAKLDDGVVISYTDSGPPSESAEYTTLVMIHGSGFNGHGFEAIHSRARNHNLRTVCINRRQYPGSTEYTAAEIAAMDADPQVVLDLLATCLAQFLVVFIEEKHIPRVSDHGTGGIVIAGWSRGCSMIVSLFSDPARLPEGAYAKLEPYIKHIIFYDASVIFGLGPTLGQKKAYLPWTDTSLVTGSEMTNVFKSWVSSYYEPPPPGWDGNPDTLPSSHLKRSDRTSLDSWTDEDLRRFYNPEAVMIADPPIRDPRVMQQATHDCLYNGELSRTFFPRVQVSYISCRRSMWLCVWAAFEAERLYIRHKEEGRPMKFVNLPQANHFFHSDDPAAFLALIADINSCLRLA
ncbi:hypothetical protein ONZ45_g12035 [Pleurotus djamor]|nr:hypothetical protein ONZ45_g12035 [Pleurotus djamor]